MGLGSMWHWLLLIVVVLLLFGRGKISELMGDFARGIKSFKQGLKEDEEVAGDTKNINGPGETIHATATKKEEVKG